jgi:hypothetical protein
MKLGECRCIVFSRLRTGITCCPVLRAASRVSGRASENRCPGRAILPPIPTVTPDKIGVQVKKGWSDRISSGASFSKAKYSTPFLSKLSKDCLLQACIRIMNLMILEK